MFAKQSIKSPELLDMCTSTKLPQFKRNLITHYKKFRKLISNSKGKIQRNEKKSKQAPDKRKLHKNYNLQNKDLVNVCQSGNEVHRQSSKKLDQHWRDYVKRSELRKEWARKGDLALAWLDEQSSKPPNEPRPWEEFIKLLEEMNMSEDGMARSKAAIAHRQNCRYNVPTI